MAMSVAVMGRLRMRWSRLSWGLAVCAAPAVAVDAALEQRREGRDGVVAGYREQDRRHGESERDGDERSGDGALEDALEQALLGFGGMRRACGCSGCHAIHLLP